MCFSTFYTTFAVLLRVCVSSLNKGLQHNFLSTFQSLGGFSCVSLPPLSVFRYSIKMENVGENLRNLKLSKELSDRIVHYYE